jgi:hypothetical protein
MMLPMRISVSVTLAAWAGCTAAANDANNNAAKKAGSSLIFLVACINAASNAKLTGACNAYPAVAMIAPKTPLLKSNVETGQRNEISSHPNALTVTLSPVSISTVVVSASMIAGPVRL